MRLSKETLDKAYQEHAKSIQRYGWYEKLIDIFAFVFYFFMNHTRHYRRLIINTSLQIMQTKMKYPQRIIADDELIDIKTAMEKFSTLLTPEEGKMHDDFLKIHEGILTHKENDTLNYPISSVHDGDKFDIIHGINPMNIVQQETKEETEEITIHQLLTPGRRVNVKYTDLAKWMFRNSRNETLDNIVNQLANPDTTTLELIIESLRLFNELTKPFDPATSPHDREALSDLYTIKETTPKLYEYIFVPNVEKFKKLSKQPFFRVAIENIVHLSRLDSDKTKQERRIDLSKTILYYLTISEALEVDSEAVNPHIQILLSQRDMNDEDYKEIATKYYDAIPNKDNYAVICMMRTFMNKKVFARSYGPDLIDGVAGEKNLTLDNSTFKSNCERNLINFIKSLEPLKQAFDRFSNTVCNTTTATNLFAQEKRRITTDENLAALANY